MIKCPECNGENLTWESDVKNNGGCVDGKIRLNEVEAIFILGCDNCSETIKVVQAHKIAECLNAKHSLLYSTTQGD